MTVTRTRSIERHFRPDEVEQLQSGLPNLAEISSEILVPFEARRLRRAAILWINRRWFFERQIDVARAEDRLRVEAWLLDEFAYAIPRAGDAPDAFTGEVKTLHADRYGISSGRSVHGGSGRVATIGSFQAKGIGVTPLAGVGANWVHSSGCASVEEGIREIIYSEVATAEFPHGAVPVVALLDAGLIYPNSADQATSAAATALVRRAIIIRPAVLRIAHAERAPLFLRSLTGFPNHQPDDARRTRDVVRYWTGDGSPRDGTTVEMCDLPELAAYSAHVGH